MHGFQSGLSDMVELYFHVPSNITQSPLPLNIICPMIPRVVWLLHAKKPLKEFFDSLNIYYWSISWKPTISPSLNSLQTFHVHFFGLPSFDTILFGHVPLRLFTIFTSKLSQFYVHHLEAGRWPNGLFQLSHKD
jgi:hypothetical protein